MDIGGALSTVCRRIESLKARQHVRLVAVSKTKSVEDILEAYRWGQRHFGENYVQELCEKAPMLPRDIQWHFIGHLQTNKVKQLLHGTGDSLAFIESVDSAKLASKINAVVEGIERTRPLQVMIQVNSSGELSKSGVAPEDSVDLARHIVEECPHLALSGIMTIGKLTDEPNDECFDVLVQCREQVAKALGRDAEELELSMGMSGDFELAISKGSTNVRVGSTIFGARRALQ
jgi:pyridoxal phosphate enzyme (YggS family)